MVTKATASNVDLLASGIGDIFTFSSSLSAGKAETALRLNQLDILESSSKKAGSFAGMEANKPVEQIRQMRGLVKKQSQASEKSSTMELAGKLLATLVAVGVALL